MKTICSIIVFAFVLTGCMADTESQESVDSTAEAETTARAPLQVAEREVACRRVLPELPACFGLSERAFCWTDDCQKGICNPSGVCVSNQAHPQNNEGGGAPNAPTGLHAE